MLTLRLNDLTLLVAPESGGAIAGWTRGATPLLRTPSPTALRRGDVHGMACFPLLPYANRIGQARFDWQGGTCQLRRNTPGHPHSLHGVGWQRPWLVETLTDTELRISLRHDPLGPDAAEWPFAFSAQQQFTLSDDALRVSLSLTSRHTAPAPAGFGLHPYFPRGSGASLRFAADGVWRNDATVLPQALVPVPAAWDHTAGRVIGSAALDNCFTGWTRRATIAWAGHGLRIEADPPFDHLQVYTPPGADFFCVEPVSHAPDAINRGTAPGNPIAAPGNPSHAPGNRGDTPGMRVLSPGETLFGSILLRVTELSHEVAQPTSRSASLSPADNP